MKLYASNMKKLICILLCLLCVCMAAVASAVTVSYRLGDESDEIALAQTALKQLKLYSAEITGHFGAKTETAVKSFQKKHGLKSSGVLDEDTLIALYEASGLFAGDGSSSHSSSSSSSSSSSGSASVSSSSLLRYDSSGDAVLKLQEDLAALGYYSGTLSGHYGSITEAAVMSFQRKNGLSADGIAGAKTLDKIASALGKKNTSSSSSKSSGSSSSSSSDTLLKYGTQSNAVRALQEDLKALGYYDSGSVTGNFGRLTKDAVMQFQRDNGLTADGVAGAKTLEKIASELGRKSSSSSASASSSSSSASSSSSSSSSSSGLLDTSVTLQKNSKNDEVKKMQQMLTSLGYYSGNVTGNYGDLTAKAVMAFQKAKGLTADGIAGKKTLAAINADYTGTGTGTSGSTTVTSKKAGNVLYESFYNWRRNYKNGEYCTVYDFSTGYSWKLRIMTSDKHMDAEPVTAEDTAIMNKAFGGKTTWTPKVVWVTFSDGKTYIGSTHNTPHETYHITDNNFKGHLCVHFPIPMKDANAIGSYATSHQEAINAGWEKTKTMQ